MLFVWEGTALLILNAPGGTVHDWLGTALPAPFFSGCQKRSL
jgi:hypothetical protein